MLRAAHAFSRRRGIVPSVRQLAEEMRLSAPTIQQHLVALRRKGYLEIDGTPHGVHFTRLALDVLEPPTLDLDQVVPVPILGTIAAGRPIEAIEDTVEPLAVPNAIAQAGDYLLRVRGRSMVDHGILDGDLVLIRPQPVVEEGQIAVAVLPGGEATLKRVYRDGGRVRLQPANAEMRPVFVDQVQIRGRLAGLIRRY